MAEPAKSRIEPWSQFSACSILPHCLPGLFLHLLRAPSRSRPAHRSTCYIPFIPVIRKCLLICLFTDLSSISPPRMYFLSGLLLAQVLGESFPARSLVNGALWSCAGRDTDPPGEGSVSSCSLQPGSGLALSALLVKEHIRERSAEDTGQHCLKPGDHPLHFSVL